MSVNKCSIKRHRVADWIKKKQKPTTCCLQETHFRAKDTHRLNVKKWKVISWKWELQESKGSNTCIRQNRP